MLREVEDQMMERMLGVEDGGAGRSGCAEFGDCGHFHFPFRAILVLSPGLHAFPGCRCGATCLPREGKPVGCDASNSPITAGTTFLREKVEILFWRSPPAPGGLTRARYLKQRPRIEGYIRGLARDGMAVLRFARHKLRAALKGTEARDGPQYWSCRAGRTGEEVAAGLMTMCAALGP